jgi:hypothetical protein
MRYLKMIMTCLLCLLSAHVVAEPLSLDKNSDEFRSIMSEIPESTHSGTWPFDHGYVHYDTLRRSGSYINGRWALSYQDACARREGMTTIPEETSWEKVEKMTCPGPDGGTVLYVEIANVEIMSALSDIDLLRGASGGCDGFTANLTLRNRNTSRDIRVTITWTNINGYDQSQKFRVDAVETRPDVLFCVYGNARKTGAVYLN